MAEATDKTAQSAEPGYASPEAARARVNARRAAEGKPPLEDPFETAAPSPVQDAFARWERRQAEMREQQKQDAARLTELFKDRPARKAAPPAAPAPEELEDEAAALARWEKAVHGNAEANGGLVALTDQPVPPEGWRHVELPASGAAAAPHRPHADQTEAELNALIAECRVLMREVAAQSARFSCGAEDRLRFMEMACRAAEAGGRVGRVVARVRAAGSGQMKENRQRIIVERVECSPVRTIAEGKGGR